MFLGPVDSSIFKEKVNDEIICDGEANVNKGSYFHLPPVKDHST